MNRNEKGTSEGEETMTAKTAGQGKKWWKQNVDEGHRELTVSDRGREDRSTLLFQANFMGSNQSAAPDTDRAAAICWEISPLIGPTEKATASALQLALDCFTSPHSRPYEQLGLPINQHNDSLLLLTRKHTGLTESDYFMVLEQCVSVLE